jgi:hypothetical protein
MAPPVRPFYNALSLAAPAPPPWPSDTHSFQVPGIYCHLGHEAIGGLAWWPDDDGTRVGLTVVLALGLLASPLPVRAQQAAIDNAIQAA